MSKADCKTCDHRHYIDGEYVYDCYSRCQDYQSRMRKKQEEKTARKKEKAILDYVIETKIKIKKMSE